MTESIRLLVTDCTTTRFAFHLREARAEQWFRLMIPADNSAQALLGLAPDADAILCYQAALAAEVIDAAPSLRFGMNSATASARGIARKSKAKPRWRCAICRSMSCYRRISHGTAAGRKPVVLTQL